MGPKVLAVVATVLASASSSYGVEHVTADRSAALLSSYFAIYMHMDWFLTLWQAVILRVRLACTTPPDLLLPAVQVCESC